MASHRDRIIEKIYRLGYEPATESFEEQWVLNPLVRIKKFVWDLNPLLLHDEFQTFSQHHADHSINCQ